MHTVRLLVASAIFLAANVNADEVRVAPDWTLRSNDGEAITLSEAVSERPVILVFWATWCPYCKALMPHIQSIRLEYGDDVRVFAIHFRDDKGDPVAFMRNAGYDFTLLHDGEDAAKLSGVWATPGVMIVDQDMNVRFDLYELPQLDFPATGKRSSHGYKSARLAPYWAAELRKSLDLVLAVQTD